MDHVDKSNINSQRALDNPQVQESLVHIQNESSETMKQMEKSSLGGSQQILDSPQAQESPTNSHTDSPYSTDSGWAEFESTAEGPSTGNYWAGFEEITEGPSVESYFDPEDIAEEQLRLTDEDFQQIVVNDIRGDLALLAKYVTVIPGTQLTDVKGILSSALAWVSEEMERRKSEEQKERKQEGTGGDIDLIQLVDEKGTGRDIDLIQLGDERGTDQDIDLIQLAEERGTDQDIDLIQLAEEKDIMKLDN